MPQITISVKNVAVVAKALIYVKSSISKIVRSATKKLGDNIVGEAKRYPSPPAGSRYVRTYKFRDSWRIKPSGSLGIMITNNASRKGRMYPIFVMGNDEGFGQASIHVGRWTLILDVAKKQAESMPTLIENELRSVIKSSNL